MGSYRDIVVFLHCILIQNTFPYYIFLRFFVCFFALFVFARLLTMYLLLASQPIYPSDVSKSWILLEK